MTAPAVGAPGARSDGLREHAVDVGELDLDLRDAPIALPGNELRAPRGEGSPRWGIEPARRRRIDRSDSGQLQRPARVRGSHDVPLYLE